MSSDDRPNKAELYGRFEQGEDRRRRREDRGDRLYMRAAHKALDISDDEDETMNTIDARRFGLGWKEIAAVGGLGALGLGIHAVSSDRPILPTPPPAIVAPADPQIVERVSRTIVATEAELYFVD